MAKRGTAAAKQVLAAASSLKAQEAGKFLRQFRHEMQQSIIGIATQARVSPNSWTDAEAGRLGPARGESGRQPTSRQRLGAIRTAERVLRLYVERAEAPRFNIEEGFLAFGFDVADADVAAFVQNKHAAYPRSQATQSAKDALLKHQKVRATLSAFPPCGRREWISKDVSQLNPYEAPGWPLVNSILGSLRRPSIDNVAFTEITPKLGKELDREIDSLIYGTESLILFGAADVPSRRFIGTTPVNLPGISCCLGLLHSPDVGGGWRSLLANLAVNGGSGSAVPSPLFAIRNEAGFEFLVGQCRVQPKLITSGDFSQLPNLAGEMIAARLQGAKVLFVADASVCEYVRGEFAAAANKAGNNAALLNVEIETIGTSDESDIYFPVPRFKIGFVLRHNDPLAELLQHCLTGSYFPIYSATLARHYARLLVDGMFLAKGEQFIVLDALPNSISSRDGLMFAHECIRAVREMRDQPETLKAAIIGKIEQAWIGHGVSK